jgi:hypothetical protein
MTPNTTSTTSATHLRREKREAKKEAPGTPRRGGGLLGCESGGKVSRVKEGRKGGRTNSVACGRVVGDVARRDGDDVVVVCETRKEGQLRKGEELERRKKRTANIARQSRETEERLSGELDALNGKASRPLVPLGVVDRELQRERKGEFRSQGEQREAERTSRNLPLK